MALGQENPTQSGRNVRRNKQPDLCRLLCEEIQNKAHMFDYESICTATCYCSCLGALNLMRGMGVCADVLENRSLSAGCVLTLLCLRTSPSDVKLPWNSNTQK